MILKTLEIFGFKSIPNRVTITFKDGIIALLGPNGCGKSNIVEAIKFVLGEQSAKSLRSKTMSDVIFNGTINRKPLNVAEVKLTLDNSEQYLSSEFSELTIKRRVFRSGESEYFINETPCNLKDIKDLFYDTGLGKSAYSIIGQGQIDNILANKPEERRFIFEEAAGINKFKLRKEEAEKKLEATETNLNQIYTIMKEVSKNYDTLKVQSEKANKARDLKKEIFNLEVDIQLIKLKKKLDIKNVKEKSEKEKIFEKIELEKSLEEYTNNLKQDKDNLSSIESKISEISKTIQDLQYAGREIDANINFINDMIKEIFENAQNIKNNIENVDNKIADIEKEITDKNYVLSQFDIKISDLEQDIEEGNENINLNRKKVEKNSDEIHLLKDRNIEDELKLKNFNLEIAELTEIIVKQLDDELKKNNYSETEKKSIEKEFKIFNKNIDTILSSKINILSEFIKTKSDSTTEFGSIVDSVNSSLIELKMLNTKLYEEITKYVKLYPNFLNEFLSAEGIITKKRAIEQKISNLQNDIEYCKKRIYELEEENKLLALKNSDLLEILSRKRSELATNTAQSEAIENLINLLEKDKKDKKNLVENYKNSLIQEEKKVEAFNASLEDKKREKVELAGNAENLRKEYKSLETKLTKSNSNLLKAEESIIKLNKKIEEINFVIQNLSLSLIETKTDIKNIYDNFYEKNSRDLHEFDTKVFDLKEKDMEILKEKLIKNNKKFIELGAINYSAPEEFLEVKERYDFLNNQIKDLETAKSNLIKITEQIQNESSQQFMIAFNKIKRNFNFMFKRLFGGGTAEIRLVDPNDVLNSGIEIFAQPPGLNLQLISLLSGGQKAMTSVALIFSIFMVKPSPFCLLDEIDAALDDANIGRFVSVLKEFSEKSQFVIITHNKKTAASSSSIIGVTMEEDGVSVVFSTTFDNASSSNLIEQE